MMLIIPKVGFLGGSVRSRGGEVKVPFFPLVRPKEWSPMAVAAAGVAFL